MVLGYGQHVAVDEAETCFSAATSVQRQMMSPQPHTGQEVPVQSLLFTCRDTSIVNL